MYDCMDTGKNGTNLSPLFFFAFILIVSHVMLNLFVLVIINSFTKYYIEEDNPLSRFEQDFEDFKEAWKLDTSPYQCMKMKVKHVSNFFKQLPKRMLKKMDIDDGAREMDVQRVILKMGIQVDDGFIYFNEMLYRVMRAQFGRVKINKFMVLQELVTQFKMLQFTLQAKSVQTTNSTENELLFLNTRNTMTVNPFLTRMYFKVSLLGGKKYTLDKVKRHKWKEQVDEQRKLYQQLGKSFKEPTYPEEAPPTIAMEIENEIYIDMSCSSDEENPDRMSKHEQSSAVQHLNSFGQESAGSIRHQAKVRKRRSEIRFMDYSELKQNREPFADVASSQNTKKLRKRITMKVSEALDPTTALNQKEWVLWQMQKKINRFERARNLKSRTGSRIRTASIDIANIGSPEQSI